MARVFIDGFEDNSYRLWDATSGAAIAAAQTGMSGNYCLNINGNLYYAKKTLPSSSEYYVKFRLYSSALTGTYSGIICLANGSTQLISIVRYNSSKILRVYRGTSSGTLLASTTTTIETGVTYLIEVYVKIDDSAGQVVVKVDGTTVVDYTGDTKPGTETTIDTIIFGRFTDTYSYCYIDDVVVDDAAWPGHSRIEGLAVTANGTTNQWDASAGSNYECVNDVDDADYIGTNVTDEVDLFTVGDLTSGDIGSVKAVQAHVSAITEGSPTPTHVQLACRSGGANYFSSDKTPLTAYGVAFVHLWETDPATAAAWTESGVNAAEFGVKAVA